MRVLVVAPDVGFVETHEQVQDVISALHPEVLLGNVTRYDLSRSLNQRTYDVIWFICHGSPQGIDLSDGTVSGDTLAQMLRSHPLKLIYLNTCDNAQVALDLHDATNAPVICTVKPVDVHTAYHSGASLARYLATGTNVRMAFEMSRPGHDSTYRMIGGEKSNGGEDRVDLILTMLQDIRAEIKDLRAISDSNRRRIDALERQVTPTMAQSIAWTVGYWLFVSTFPITFYDVRQATGLSAGGGLLVIILLAAIAYVPLSRGLRMELWDI